MARRFGSTYAGGSFDHVTIGAVWNKGAVVPGYDPARLRKDQCGAWIARDEYGQTTNLGWEIDHVKPVVAGGPDDLWNLQPLHWENNRGKADEYPSWSCSCTARAR